MEEEDDLDAEFALFERQIEKVAAKRPISTTAPSAPSLPSISATPALKTPSNAPITPSKSEKPLQGRWKWDGSAWHWRTDLQPSPPSFPALHHPPCPTPHDPLTAPISNSAASIPIPVPVPASISDSVSASTARKRKCTKRTAAGTVWRDPSLADWPEGDFRIFVGDLAPDATDNHLSVAFSKYSSFNMARIVVDKRSGLCRGYGFVSFADGKDMVAALTEMNGKYVGGRPVKLRRSNWQKRALTGDKWKEIKTFRTITKSR